jgi:protein-tyrosine phosphatase
VTTVVEVEVDSLPMADGGGLQVRWVLEGESGSVDVAVGPTPETVDHRHAETVPAERREVRLADPGPGRHYVSVSPTAGGSAVVASERRVPFEGVTNFRDLGGYPVAGGGRTRWGRVFRADALSGLNAVDLVTFERLGLRAVYDLRGDDERELRPNPVPSVALPLVGQPVMSYQEPGTGFDSLDLTHLEDGERWLGSLYLGMLERSGPVFGQLLGGLVGDQGTPAVFHCAGGKDRTGMAAALLLLALGVDQEVVLDDYVLSSRYRTRDSQAASLAGLLATGMSAEAAAGVLTTPRHAMAAALDVLRAEHGGAVAYLTGPGGLDLATIDQLRTDLVTP